MIRKSRFLFISARGLMLALLVAALGVPKPPAARADTIDVTTQNDVVDANGGVCTGMTPSDLPGPDGQVSLREAVCAANGNPGADVINLPTGTYTLTIPTTHEDNNADGDLDILAVGGDLTISGAGAGETIISGGGIDRVFHIDPAGIGGLTVNISGVTVQQGYVNTGNGGGINNGNGTVNIANSTLSGNQALGGKQGGGIHNGGGTMTIANSTISGNEADADGGGIYSNGTMTITNSTIYSNTTTSGGSGGGLYQQNGTANITNSTIYSNTTTSGGSGGGLYQQNGTANITNSTIYSNTTTGGGSGGGIYNADGVANITSSTLSGNQAANGGGIYQWVGTVNIADSTLSGNQATSFGGGIRSSGTIAIANSTFYSNTASYGGGIRASGTVSVTNSTLSGNQATGAGGGMWLEFVMANLIHVTIAENTADSDGNGGGDGGGIHRDNGTVNLKGSIVADNSDESPAGNVYPDCSGTFVSHGYNLIGDGTGSTGLTDGVNNDQVGSSSTPLDPALGILGDNGGPSTGSGQATWTHALLAGSPAIDAIPVVSCTLTIDQRGVARPQRSACDVGAYEAEYRIYLPLILRGA